MNAPPGVDDVSQAHAARTDILLSMGRFQDALQPAGRAVAEDPQSAEARFDLARCHLGLKQWQQAYEAAASSVRLAPDWAPAHYIMSLVLHRLLHFAGELAAAEQAVRLQPEEPVFLDRLARAQIQSGLLHKARDTAAQLVKLAPDDTDTHILLADICIELQDFETAEPHVRQALSQQPDELSLHNDLGRVMMGRKQWLQAIDAFLGALKIDAGNDVARGNLKIAVNAWLDSQILQGRQQALDALPAEVSRFYRYEQEQRGGFARLGRAGPVIAAVAMLVALVLLFGRIAPQ